VPIDVNKVANDTLSHSSGTSRSFLQVFPGRSVDRSIRFDLIERSTDRGWGGGGTEVITPRQTDSSYDGQKLPRDFTKALRKYLRPHVYPAPSISPIHLTDPRHATRRALGTSRSAAPGVYLLFFRKEKPPESRSRSTGERRTRGMMNAGVEFGLSARTARRIASSRTDLALE